MVDLRDAVAQISEIRQQMAHSAVFRGYRPATTAFTALVALAAAITQKIILPNPVRDPLLYLDIWVGAALVSMIVVAVELILWVRRNPSPMRTESTVHAIEQFAPCIVGGGLLTLVIAMFEGQIIWTLAGLWPILFGIGMFASRRMVGKALSFVGAFYLLAGLLVLTRGPGDAMNPLYMGGIFCIGQLMAAVVVYFNRRKHDVE